MDHVSYILTGLMTLCMVVLIAPGILAMNHGKILKNIALWLAIFLGLGLAYKNFGPGSPHPLIHAPAASQPPASPAGDTSTTGAGS